MSDDMLASLSRHPQTGFNLGERVPPTPYQPTYLFTGNYINLRHATYAKAPRRGLLVDLGIFGWLRIEDVLKLYELAFFSEGDVLELGTNRGLSASILAAGLVDAGNGHQLTSVEIRPELISSAEEALAARGLDSVVRFRCGDCSEIMREMQEVGSHFSLAFIDHSHAYGPVLDVCQMLENLLMPGGFALFHDYTDSRNSSRQNVGESEAEYGVFAGIKDGLSASAFDFYGCYGCCGLFRRKDVKAMPLTS